MSQQDRVSILGVGNLGVCIARGLVSSGNYRAEDVTIFVISLEGPAGKRTKDLRKQFKKLLKKVKL